jgi:cytochrome c oxidase cbb3-type subunit 3
MSDFWSGWVMLLIVLNLGIAIVLFLWAPRVEIPTQPDGTTGHVWAHGVLKEAVRALPMLWIVPSAVVLVIAIGYLVLYPGFGANKGTLGWTSRDELARDTAANAQLGAPIRERLRGKTIEEIAADPEALRAGRVLFIDNCAACHGREGRGNRALGAPDLTDGDWLYGGDGKAILASILDGRRGAMPPFAASLSGEDIKNVANYVLSLSGGPDHTLRAQFGKSVFTNCVPCHGADGKGNIALGAPNLTDSAWLYGNDLEDIATSVSGGRNGVMPAWRERLGEERSTLVAAWVYAQSRPVSAQPR